MGVCTELKIPTGQTMAEAPDRWSHSHQSQDTDYKK